MMERLATFLKQVEGSPQRARLHQIIKKAERAHWNVSCAIRRAIQNQSLRLTSVLSLSELAIFKKGLEETCAKTCKPGALKKP